MSRLLDSSRLPTWHAGYLDAYSFVDGEVKLWNLHPSGVYHPSGVRRGLTGADYRQAYDKTPAGKQTKAKANARHDAKAYECGARISLLESEAVQTSAVLI